MHKHCIDCKIPRFAKVIVNKVDILLGMFVYVLNNINYEGLNNINYDRPDTLANR